MVNVQEFMKRARLTAEGLKKQKTQYYKYKKSWETIMKIVNGMRRSFEAKEAKAKTTYKITDREKDSIGQTIEKYQNYKASGDEQKDKTAGKNLLQKYENNARMSTERYLGEMRKDPNNESIKTKYYQQKDRYTQIAKMTGYLSPAKIAIRKGLELAKITQKENIVYGSVKNAKTPKDVAKALVEAGATKEVAEVLEREEDNVEV